jgi:DMSO reductase family type II enzyme chaperone
MNARDEMAGPAGDAAGRSGLYGALASAFTYEGAACSALAIPGTVFNEAFDPSVCKSACSLREGAYADVDQTALFEELMRFYGFFGLKRAERAAMPDHLSVEFQFMHFLAHLESRSTGDPAALASLARAQRDFLQRHLHRAVHGVKGALKSADPGCIELVETASDFVDREIKRLIEA